MKEILRFSHVFTEDLPDGRLRDFNLTVFSGEIISLIGSRGSGKHLLKMILSGDCSITAGALYFHEQKAEYSEKSRAWNEGFFCVDQEETLVEALTVSENIFLVKQHRKRKIFYNSKTAFYETLQILKSIGLQCSPSEKVYHLSFFEKYLICIAKALAHHARLLLLDLSGNTYNHEDYKHLERIIRQGREQGLSFLVIDNAPNPLLELSDKVVIINDGRDIKTIFQEQGSLLPVSSYFMSPEHLEIQSPKDMKHNLTANYLECMTTNKTALFSWNPGWLIGFYDSSDLCLNFIEYLNRFLEENEGQFLISGIALPLREPEVVYIPELSRNHLIPNLSIADNLLMPRYRRLTGITKLIDPSLGNYCVKEFFSYFSIEGNPEQISELSFVDRYLLFIYSWAATKPKLFLIENPTLGMDLQSRSKIWDYLQKLSCQGTAILVNSPNIDILYDCCTGIVCSQDARFEYLRYRKEASWRQK